MAPILISPSLAVTYLMLGNYYNLAGDSERYSEFVELGKGLATKINHPFCQMQALRQKGHIARSRGRYHESVKNHREAQKLARLTGRVQDECLNLAAEAFALCCLGNFPESQATAVECYELVTKKGYEGSDVELSLLASMVQIHWQKTEYTEARQLTKRLVQMTSRHRSPDFHANSLSDLVELDLITGMDDGGILQNLVAARELATELRFHPVVQMCDFSEAKLDLRNGDRMKAYRKFQILGGGTKSHIQVVYLSLANLGDLSNNLCGLEKTFHWATVSLAFSRKRKHLGHTYQALRYLGDILLAQGDEQTAMNIFQAVLDASTEMDVHRRRADCMSRIGDILLRRGEPEKAKDMWEAALPLFVRSSQANDAAAIETRLAKLARRDLDVHWEIPDPRVFTQKSAEGGVAPGEEAETAEDTTTEIPVELVNLRAPTGQPIVASKKEEVGIRASGVSSRF